MVLRLSCGLAVIAGAVVWVAAGRAHHEIRITFLAALPFLPLISLTRVRQASMQGLHRVSLGAMPEQLIQPVIFLFFLLAAAGAQVHIGGPAAMLANAAAGAVAFAAGVMLLRRSLPEAASRATPLYKSAEWFRAALPLVFVAGVAIVFAQADTLILGAFRDQSAVGIYSVAHKGSELISAVLMTQVSAFASTAANLYALRDMARLQRLVTKLARLTLLVSAPVIAGMIVFGRWYLVLYGPAFTGARATLAILSLGQAINVVSGCAGMLLVTTGHEHRIARAIGAGAITNVALSCALAPRWGAVGVAIGYAASMGLWNVWAAIDLYRLTGIDSTAFGCDSRTPAERGQAKAALG
jgi:O-antigen/teichoic acid export membrane protein